MSINQQARSGLKWSAIERFATQAVQLIVMLILAKQLGPEAFGLVGLVAVVLSIAQVFVDSGFSTGLIRKLDRTEADFSTTFYFSVAVSFICYGVTFFIAPHLAIFFEKPELELLMQVAAFSIVINAFAIIQRAKLTIDVNFKVQAKCSFSAVFFSSIVGLYGAYNGFGVWSLVAQTLCMALLNVIFLNITVTWFPSKPFCKASFKELFGFGSKLLLSGLIDRVFKNIYPIIIGKYFTVFEVGQFNQAQQLTSIPAMTFTSVIQRVSYPVLSKLQDNKEEFSKGYLLSLRLAAMVMFPLFFGVSLIVEDILPLVIGLEWKPAANMASILALALMLYPIHAINLNILNVKGRSDLFLRLEIIKKVLTVIVLFVTIPHGIKAICFGIVFQSYVALLINTYYTGVLSSITLQQQFKSLSVFWVIALIATYGVGLIVDLFVFNTLWLSLALNILIGLVFYFSFIRKFHSDLLRLIFKKE